jgi:hypothetical protein
MLHILSRLNLLTGYLLAFTAPQCRKQRRYAPLVDGMENRMLLTGYDTGLTGNAAGQYTNSASITPLEAFGDSYGFTVGDGATIDASITTPTDDPNAIYTVSLMEGSRDPNLPNGVIASNSGQGTVQLPEMTGHRDSTYAIDITGTRVFSTDTSPMPYTVAITTGSGEPQVDLAITSAALVDNNTALQYSYSAINDPEPYLIRLYASETDQLPSPLFNYNPVQSTATLTDETNAGTGTFDFGSPFVPTAGTQYLVLYISSNALENDTDNNVFAIPIGTPNTPTPSPVINLVSSSNPSAYGQPVTFTATVSAASAGLPEPTGTVTVMDGSTDLGTGMVNASGIATFTSSTLAVGAHSITAIYGGDSTYNGGDAALTQTVVASPPLLDIHFLSFTKNVGADSGKEGRLESTGNYELRYSVSGGLLPSNSNLTLAVYWATGPNKTDIIAGVPPVSTGPLSQSAITQPFIVSIADLLNPPPTATDLVVVLNNQDAIAETHDSTTVGSLLPDDLRCPVSAELTRVPSAATRYEQVRQWLSIHSATIIHYATLLHVDRIGIAGAIAWEALQNPNTLAYLHYGPGKPHPSSRDVAAVENRRVRYGFYIAPKNYFTRLVALRHNNIAIQYIAAMMNGYVIEVKLSGGFADPDALRETPGILATFYNGSDIHLHTAQRDLAAKRALGETTFNDNDTMGQWVTTNTTYLEQAVGMPDPY